MDLSNRVRPIWASRFGAAFLLGAYVGWYLVSDVLLVQAVECGIGGIAFGITWMFLHVVFNPLGALLVVAFAIAHLFRVSRQLAWLTISLSLAALICAYLGATWNRSWLEILGVTLLAV